MPLISVVIPTRNRLPYLMECVQSVLDSRGPDIEIIVADNATDDGTAEYLASLGDAIRVTRSDTLLSMADNWSRALELVRGEWVIFIGDDDCVMPDFGAAARLGIEAHPGAELIFWDTPIYRWPSSINEAERNLLSFTLRTGPQIISSKESLRMMFEEIVNIMAPPGLYHGLSRTSLIRKAKDQWGEFRLGKVPDLGSGLLYLALTESFVRLQRPLSVMAFGSKSTGMAYKNGKKDFAPRAEFARLSHLEDLKIKYPLIDIEDPNVYQWRVLLDWQDYLREHGVPVTLNNSKMFIYCISRINVTPIDERAEAAAKMIEFGVNHGMSRDELTAMVAQATSMNWTLRPRQSAHREGDNLIVSLTANLTTTPIRTARQAAGLIYGHLSL